MAIVEERQPCTPSKALARTVALLGAAGLATTTMASPRSTCASSMVLMARGRPFGTGRRLAQVACLHSQLLETGPLARLGSSPRLWHIRRSLQLTFQSVELENPR